MKKKEDSNLPKNPTEAQGLLIKAIYEKFGADALPLIRDVCGKQGQSLGARIKRKMPDNRLSTIAEAFSKSFDPATSRPISISDDRFHIQGTRCPFGLENTSRELCEAVMEIDACYFKTAVDSRIKLEIKKTVADGDDCCDTIYTLTPGS